MKKVASFIYQTLLVFALLGMLFIPFSFTYLSFASDITPFLFEDLVLFIAKSFNLNILNSEFSSDATTLYLLIIVLFIISILFITLQFLIFKSKKINYLTTRLIPIIICYYLALVLLKYGFDKLFKVQFYAPEPNILYTPFGQLDRDILFWSTMGTSHSYSVFMGFLEIIPALLLLYRKTRVLGLFILLGVLINVVAINFSFDISVKLFATFLLFICALLCAPHFKIIFAFFIFNQNAKLKLISDRDVIASKCIRLTIKTFIILLIFFETLFPFLLAMNFNGDAKPKIYLHGAYEVENIVANDMQTNASQLDIKRIFIHKNNYFILQYEDGTFEDYYFQMDKAKSILEIKDYDNNTKFILFEYDEEGQILRLKLDNPNITIVARALNWKKLPALQPLFHLTVDEISD